MKTHSYQALMVVQRLQRELKALDERLHEGGRTTASAEAFAALRALDALAKTLHADAHVRRSLRDEYRLKLVGVTEVQQLKRHVRPEALIHNPGVPVMPPPPPEVPMALTPEDKKQVVKRIIDVLTQLASVNSDIKMMDFVEALDAVKRGIIKSEVSARLAENPAPSDPCPGCLCREPPILKEVQGRPTLYCEACGNSQFVDEMSP